MHAWNVNTCWAAAAQRAALVACTLTPPNPTRTTFCWRQALGGSMSRQRIRSRTVHKHTQLYTYIAHTIQRPNEPPIYIYMRLNEPPTDTLTNCTQTHTTIHIYSSYHSVAQRAAYIYIYMCGSMSRQRIRSGTVHKHTQLYTYIAHTIQRPNEPPIYIYIYVFLFTVLLLAAQ